MIALSIVLACLTLNAVLACAEMAFVTIDEKSLRKLALGGDKRAIYLEKMFKSPERILSVVQIGITLVGAISGAVSGAGAEETFGPLFMEWFGVSQKVAEATAITVVVAPLTILSVVIGELVPKSLAIKFSMPIILNLAPALMIAEKVLGPLVNPMEKSTDFILKLILRSKTTNVEEAEESEISLKGVRKEYREYFQNLLDLDSKTVGNIMVPWDKVDYLDSTVSSNDISVFIMSRGRTRIPVVDSNEVYGYLHSKEFINLLQSGVADNWLSFVRSVQILPVETKLLDALRKMQKSKAHFMIVGSREFPLGIVTLEDILEDVFGDFEDEDQDGRLKLFLRRFK